METQQLQKIAQYIDIALRRKALIITCVLLGVAAGLAVYLLQPKVYQSTTLLSYQQQSVNPAKMSPDVQAQIQDIVSTLTQIVTSRTSLEKIITDVGLYKKQINDLPMEDVIELMRRNIMIIPSREGDTFHITFKGSNPQQVVRVTNTIAARFVEENMKYREERASETSAYTEDELQMAKEMLDRKEAIMRDYKLKFYNEMPDQRSTNVSRLIALQEQYQSRQESIQDLERTRVLIRDQIAARKELIEENEKLVQALNEKEGGPTVLETEQAQVARLEAELESLQQRYTEKHPAIKQLKKQIAHLEASYTQNGSGEASSGSGVRPVLEQFDKVLMEFEIQLKDISLSIEELNREKEKVKTQIEQYEKWVSAAPVREAEWSALTREYGELKRHYDFLVSQNLQARSALNLERKQKGSQFKIEDPARMPEKPVKPDFLKIMGIALAGGLGLGGALSFGLSLLDTSFRDPAELENTYNIEVICSVPHVPLPREVFRKRLWAAGGTLFFLACGVALAGAMLYFWQQGRIIL